MFTVVPLEDVTKVVKKELDAFSKDGLSQQLQTLQSQIVSQVLKEMKTALRSITPPPPAVNAEITACAAASTQEGYADYPGASTTAVVPAPSRRGGLRSKLAAGKLAQRSGFRGGRAQAARGHERRSRVLLTPEQLLLRMSEALSPMVSARAPGLSARARQTSAGAGSSLDAEQNRARGEAGRGLLQESSAEDVAAAEAAVGTASAASNTHRSASNTHRSASNTHRSSKAPSSGHASRLQSKDQPASRHQSKGSTPATDDVPLQDEFLPPAREEASALLGDDGSWQDSPCQLALTAIVESARFEHITLFAVFANCILLGYETQLLLEGSDSGFLIGLAEFGFCMFYVFELLARWLAYGFVDFYATFGEWAYFDTSMVCVQVVDQLLTVFTHDGRYGNVTALRMLRLLRAIRIIRLVRMWHLSESLQDTFTAMASSMRPACWAFVTFLVWLYMSSVLLLQTTMSYNATSIPQSHDLSEAFSDIWHTMLTMFQCLLGGLEWSSLVRALMEGVSPQMACWFCGYFLVGVFLMLNLVVTVFIDKVIKAVREDKDELAMQNFAAVFQRGSEDEEVNWEVFADKLSERAVVEYFHSIDVPASVTSAKALFELIDMDSSGGITQDEIVQGCMRLKGPARALEVALIQRDTGRIADVLDEVRRVAAAVDALTARFQQSSDSKVLSAPDEPQPAV
eukprot:TRINITY_DN9730_c0_g1_i2.p1 TRINITY_DN9730_c0_g1~~TRINITY_DN9730_c0_g1_i2.p1  ORF type:complete len:686 (-),score=107.21 TRINITY_DN9730_c0_g1_i2:289-2346(-)